jgi:hypothetical protein
MISQLKEKLFPTEPTVTFYDRKGYFCNNDITNIKLARDVKPQWWNDQKNEFGHVKFAHCPGMLDYMQTGWIIPAWADIRIMSNSAGVIATASNSRENMPLQEDPEFKPVPMNADVIKGIRQFETPNAVKIHAPWSLK